MAIHPRGRWLAAVAVSIAAAIAFVACGDSEDHSSADLLTAASYLEHSDYHDVDQAIQGGSIPATAETTITRLRTAVLVSEWPKELQPKANQLASRLGAVETALAVEKPDVAQVQKLSADAHTSWHEFSTEVWDHLREDTGVAKPGPTATPHSH